MAYGQLTRRQTEVLALLALGWTTAQIAARLGISPRTVEKHRAFGMSAIGAATRAEVVQWSIRTGRFTTDFASEYAQAV